MRRWLSVLLMLLLPLQVSWSVAAEYGNHSATLASPHAELHVHEHAHDGPAADVAHAGDPADADHHATCCDLHQCHSHGSFAALTTDGDLAIVATAAGYAPEQAGRLRSREATRIERPKWAAPPITS